MALRKVTNNTIADNTVIGTNIQIRQIQDYHLATSLSTIIDNGNNNAWVNSNDFTTYNTLSSGLDAISANIAALSINNSNFLWTNTNVATGSSNVFFIGQDTDNILQVNLYKDGLLQTPGNYILNSVNNSIQFKDSSISVNSEIVIDSFYYGPDKSFVYEKDNLITLSKLRFLDKYNLQEPTTSLNPKRITNTEKLFETVQSAYTYTINNKRQIERVNPNTVRIMHNANTGARLGIYKEADRNNHFKQVLDLESGTNWVISGSDLTVTNNTAESPDSSTNGTSLTSLATNSTSHVVSYSSIELPNTSFATYVFDVFCKPENYNNFGMRVTTTSGNLIVATANLANSVIHSEIAGTWKLEKYANNWNRLIGSNFVSDGAPFSSLSFGFMPDGVLINEAYLGNASVGGYVWAPKLEKSNVAHMPILNDTTNSIIDADIVSTTVLFENYLEYENGLSASITPLGTTNYSELDPLILFSLQDDNNITTFVSTANLAGNLNSTVNAAYNISDNGYIIGNVLNTDNITISMNTASQEYNQIPGVQDTKNWDAGSRVHQPYISKDGKRLYAVAPINDIVYENILSESYNLDTTIATVNFNSASSPGVVGLTFNENEDKMYLSESINSSSMNVHTYFLSTAGYLNTASLISTAVLNTSFATSTSIRFSKDGNYFFHTTSYGIEQFNLSESWNVETATPYVFVSKLSNWDTIIRSMDISNDGYKLYVYPQTFGNSIVYHMTEKHDITTIKSPDFFNLVDNETWPTGFTFSNTGHKMFVTGWSNNVHEFALSENYNIQTSVYSNTFTTGISAAMGVEFNNTGSVMLVSQDPSTISEFKLTENYNIQTAVLSNTFSTSANISSIRDVTMSNVGTNVYVASGQGKIVQYQLSTPDVMNTATAVHTMDFSTTNDIIPITLTAGIEGIRFNNSGNTLFIANSLNPHRIYQIPLANSWDISSYEKHTKFSVNAQEPVPLSVCVSNPGHKMYVTGTSEFLYEYDLSSNFVSNTATFVQSFNLITGNASISNGMEFARINPDGNVIFAVDVNDRLYQYDLSENWNIASATCSAHISLNNRGFHNGLYVSPDGLTVFTFSGSLIQYHTFNDSWNVASYNTTVSAYDTEAGSGIHFSDDGLKWYYMSTVADELLEYTLTESYNVATRDIHNYNSYSGVKEIESFPIDIFFDNAGINAYMIGYAADAVFQIKLVDSYDLSVIKNPTFIETTGTFFQGVEDIAFNDTGNTMYMLSDEDDAHNVYSIALSDNFTINHDYSKFADILSLPSFTIAEQYAFLNKSQNKLTRNFKQQTLTTDMPISGKVNNHSEFNFYTFKLGELEGNHNTTILHNLNLYNKLLSNTELDTLSN